MKVKFCHFFYGRMTLEPAKRSLIMDRPEDKKGALVIRTRFGEVSAEPGVNFNQTLKGMTEDTAWREEAGAESGPFCYTDLERNVPF